MTANGAPFDRDRGSVSVGLVLIVVIAIAGAALIFDGARYLAAERHARNPADGAVIRNMSTSSAPCTPSPIAKRRSSASPLCEKSTAVACPIESFASNVGRARLEYS